jgi:hypothetical protein
MIQSNANIFMVDILVRNTDAIIVILIQNKLRMALEIVREMISIAHHEGNRKKSIA